MYMYRDNPEHDNTHSVSWYYSTIGHFLLIIYSWLNIGQTASTYFDNGRNWDRRVCNMTIFGKLIFN